eukprot:1481228-Prymnesium_polylepis.1
MGLAGLSIAAKNILNVALSASILSVVVDRASDISTGRAAYEPLDQASAPPEGLWIESTLPFAGTG